ncbi:MAG TPA: hypothetical protein VK588_17100 [Chitinophagaceae bacterium]|nr:hypothetical protein [Chitinophagaceae bacterium]
MATIRYKVSSTRDLPKGSRVVSANQLEKVNGRLKTAMQTVVRANQKKQRQSLEKASRTVLNA